MTFERHPEKETPRSAGRFVSCSRPQQSGQMSQRLTTSLAAYAAVATAMSARPASIFFMTASSSIAVRIHHTPCITANQAGLTAKYTASDRWAAQTEAIGTWMNRILTGIVLMFFSDALHADQVKPLIIDVQRSINRLPGLGPADAMGLYSADDMRKAVSRTQH